MDAEVFILKTLDNRHVMDGIDHTNRDIDSLKDQVGDIQRAVRDFYSLDETLKGKTGESIRDFFQDVHEPLLIYLHQSLIDYKTALTEMKDSVETFESSENGFVRQEFLEEDVEDGLNHTEKRATELTDDANSILERVQDIVNVNKIDDSEVLETVEKGKKKSNHIIGKLTKIDKQETSQLEKTKQDLSEMKSYLADMKSGLKNGGLSVTNFDRNAVTNMDVYKSIVNDIYGEGYVESKKIEPLLDKMLNGDNLTGEEREKLYDYFQNEYLDAKSKEEVEWIADSMNKDGISDLKERLNEKVVLSKNALEDELAIVQAYVYIGGKKPGNSHLNDINKKAKLEFYLKLLEKYHSTMEKEEGTVIKVDTLEYEQNKGDIPGHYIFSALQTEEYNDHEAMMDEQSFRAWMSDPENSTVNNYSLSEISYYTGTNASANHEDEQLQELEEEEAHYTPHFILNKVGEKVLFRIPFVGQSLDAVDVATSKTEHHSEKQKLGNKIKIGEARKVSKKLNLEFAISKNQSVPDSGKDYDVDLYPQDKTYNIIDRWQKVHGINQAIPYPDKEIYDNDWYETGKVIREIENDSDPELINYIIDDTLRKGQTVEEIAHKYNN